MPKHNLITSTKIAQVLNTAADAGGRTGRRVSLKNNTMMTLLALIAQGSTTPVTLTLSQSLDAAGTGAKPLANPVPIWANADAANSDTFTRQGDGVAFTTSGATGDKQVAFHIDPANLDVNNGYAFITLTTGASNGSNITSVLAIGDGSRYRGEPVPSIF